MKITRSSNFNKNLFIRGKFITFKKYGSKEETKKNKHSLRRKINSMNYRLTNRHRRYLMRVNTNKKNYYNRFILNRRKIKLSDRPRRTRTLGLLKRFKKLGLRLKRRRFKERNFQRESDRFENKLDYCRNSRDHRLKRIYRFNRIFKGFSHAKIYITFRKRNTFISVRNN